MNTSETQPTAIESGQIDVNKEQEAISKMGAATVDHFRSVLQAGTYAMFLTLASMGVLGVSGNADDADVKVKNGKIFIDASNTRRYLGQRRDDLTERRDALMKKGEELDQKLAEIRKRKEAARARKEAARARKEAAQRNIDAAQKRKDESIVRIEKTESEIKNLESDALSLLGF